MTTITIPSVPVDAFEEMVMNCKSQYIILKGQTGSGKSTRLPLWAHKRGLSVLMTEPLIETVIGTGQYIAELLGCKFGETVGYKTGQESLLSIDTSILLATDGLALVRELARKNKFNWLIIDELHQWNTHQSTLEAWAWKDIQNGTSPFDKVIVLSASLDSDELSRKRGNSPVFEVPGRQYDIQDCEPGVSLIADVEKFVKQGCDVLVFQPGKREIDNCIEDLKKLGLDAELIPFHGMLDRTEKNQAYVEYDRPKIVVSTNALETGRTLLPSKGRNLAVIDSGLERRVELIDGVEMLVLRPISKAQRIQRRGRTGRVGLGFYVDHCPSASRSEFPIPEILRTRLDQTVLRLKVAGYEASDLPFFHNLDPNEILRANRSLISLGAFDKTGQVTQVGRMMAKLPVSVQCARMIVEAQRLGVVDDIVTIAAIIEVETIKAKDSEYLWGRNTTERESDLLAELDIFKAARGLSQRTARTDGR